MPQFSMPRQAGITRRRRVAHAHALLGAPESGLPGAAGDLAGRAVLVLGPVVASTMCALAMAECRRAESRMPGCRVEPGCADVVLVPEAPREAVPGILGQAVTALAGGGTLALRLPRAARAAAHELRNRLAEAGFAGIREIAAGGDRILVAAAPAFQPSRVVCP